MKGFAYARFTIHTKSKIDVIIEVTSCFWIAYQDSDVFYFQGVDTRNDVCHFIPNAIGYTWQGFGEGEFIMHEPQ